MPDLNGRLTTFLEKNGQPTAVEVLHPDASSRGYYRVTWNGLSAVACVYPETLDPAVGTYIDVTGLFIAGGLPVAEIIDFDPELAVVVQEDLGNRIMRDDLTHADALRSEELLNEAIRMIARIQATTPLAYERDSIASRLKFDTEKLSWELGYFKTHYFTTFLGQPLSTEEDTKLTIEFKELSSELDSYAAVLCHRDFHAANLMIDTREQMRIIDHQDARIGSAAYDLVSLLLDRITELPSEEWLENKRDLFMTEREEQGLEPIESTAFAYEFRLQTIQRCLKAAGTFSYQAAVRGKTHFIPFIMPMFGAALRAVESIDRFATLRAVLEQKLGEAVSPL